MTVFLSYAREDAPTVDALARELDHRRIAYWRDLRDLPVAYAWSPEARTAIRAASLVVICRTPSWNASTACRTEREMAEELHKIVLYVDLQDLSAAEVVRAVEAGLAGLGQVDEDHRELLVRSGAWAEGGHQAAGLLRGEVLSRLSRVETLDRKLPPDAHALVEESSGADRVRTRRRVLGTLLVSALLVAGPVAQKFSTRTEEAFQQQSAVVAQVTEVHARTLASPYKGMLTAAAVVRGGDAGTLGISALVEALDIPVPAESFEMAGEALTGFVDRPGIEPVMSTDTGAVVDVRGTPLPDRPSAATPEPRAARLGGLTAQARQADLTATGTGSGTVLIRSGIASGLEITPDFAASPVAAIALNTATNAVAILHADSGSVTIHDATSGALRVRVAVGSPARAVALSPDGRTLAAAVADGVVLADLTTGRPQLELRGPTEPTRAVTWSADGASVFAINGGHRVSRWQWRNGQRLVDEPDAWFVGLSAAGPDGAMFAVTRAGDVYRIEPGGNQVIARTGAIVTSVGFDPSAEHVLLSVESGATRIVDLRTGADRIVDDGRGCQSVTPTFVPGSAIAMVGCFDGPVRRLDLAGGGPARDLDIPAGTGAVTAGPDGIVYVAGATGLAYRTTADLAPVETMEVPSNATFWRTVTVSADGRTLLLTGTGTGKLGHFYVGRRDGDSWSWYTIDLPPDEGEQARSAALSPDGRVAAIGMVSGAVHFVAAQTGDLGLTHTEVSGSVTAAAFAGDRLVVATRTGLIATLDACAFCDSADAFLRISDQRLGAGRSMGFVPG